MPQIRIINKLTDEYQLFSRGFREVFDSKYTFETPSQNFYRTKDNIYFIMETEQGEVMAGLNISFLSRDLFHKIRKGEVVDDMTFSYDDIAYLSGCEEIFAYLPSIFVSPTFQNQGNAQILLKHGLATLKSLSEGRKTQVLALCIHESSKVLLTKFEFKEVMINTQNDYVMMLEDICASSFQE